MMQQTFDLRPATLAANYRISNTTPRALLMHDPPAGGSAESRV